MENGSKRLSKAPTGTQGQDEIVSGGLPKGRQPLDCLKSDAKRNHGR